MVLESACLMVDAMIEALRTNGVKISPDDEIALCAAAFEVLEQQDQVEIDLDDFPLGNVLLFEARSS